MCGDASDCEDTLQWEEDILQPLLAKYEPRRASMQMKQLASSELCPPEHMHLLVKMLQAANSPRLTYCTGLCQYG